MVLPLKELKEKLEKEREVLKKELANLGVLDKDAKDWGAIYKIAEDADRADDNTSADYEEEFNEKAATTEELEFRLSDIEKALKNMEGDNYGICVVCKKEIEEKRLLANPAAATCIAHRESLKHKHI